MADDIEKTKRIRRLRKFLRFHPLRFVHIFLSIILTLYGAAILLVTLTVKEEFSDYQPFLHYYLDKPVIVLFLGSIVLVGLGCLGFISSGQNIYQGIVTFGVLLFGLFMFKFTMGIVFLAVSSSADKSITQALITHMANYTGYSDAIDYIQTNLNCCGINDFSDWNSTLGYIPGSCCESDNACDNLNLNETGCYAALKELINFLIHYLVIILGVLAAVQVTAMLVTFFFARGIADCRRKITGYSEEGDFTDGGTGQAQNPLGIRNNNASDPIPEKMLDREVPEPGIGGRKDIVRNPIYRDDSFTSNNNNNIRHKVLPTAPKLPQEHRKYPLGILRQGYKR